MPRPDRWIITQVETDPGEMYCFKVGKPTTPDFQRVTVDYDGTSHTAYCTTCSGLVTAAKSGCVHAVAVRRAIANGRFPTIPVAHRPMSDKALRAQRERQRSAEDAARQARTAERRREMAEGLDVPALLARAETMADDAMAKWVAGGPLLRPDRIIIAAVSALRALQRGESIPTRVYPPAPGPTE